VETKPNRKRLRQLCEAFVTQALSLPEWNDYDRVKALPEFEAVYAFAENEGLVAKFGVQKSDADGKPVPPGAADLWWLYLLPLMERCFKGGFEKLYPLLEESLYADHATWQVVAPLPRFIAQGGSVELPNGVAIRELAPSEKQYLDKFQESIGFGEAIGLGLLDVSFAMSCRKQLPKAGPMQGEMGDDHFEPVVTALRLLKGGAVWYNLQIQCLEYPPFGTHYPVDQRGGGWASKPKVYGPKYELLGADVERLKELVASLSRTGRRKKLQVAMGRFNGAYERKRPDDKLVDLWIALEALFLKSSERMELTYKAALRIARFVGRDAPERVEIFEGMKNSYNARSRVVHGDPPPRDIADTTAFTEEVVRKALRSSVLSGSGPDLDELDLDAVRADVKE